MKEYLKKIEEKIVKNFKIEEIKIIDNSKMHSKHKFFDSEKYHLSIDIESNYLKSLNKIDSHRLIMSLLKEELKTKIHALEIKIK